MIFNSIDFAIFLPIVFLLYWFVFNGRIKAQNALIVASSYLFYGWWDWRFLSLILFSTFVDFLVGKRLKTATQPLQRKTLLWTSLFINLGLLAVFKYYNFFIENFAHAFSLLGSQIQVGSLQLILPIGISFYTFQTLSYSIDVYKRKLNPTDDFIEFAAFVSFFPQLVAGPIERASQLLPQFATNRVFDYAKAVDGMKQILWGLFKKIVIADNCAVYVNMIFNQNDQYSGSTLLIGALFFSFQIYGDFSGYSDIAIGTSRLFGFNLLRNFNFPYFSRDIAEFWRRWHISLSTWFRDYLYVPLGGSKGTILLKVRNTFIIFLVSGFWHGANWTFIAWGALNAVYFLPLLLSKKNRSNLGTVAQGRMFPTLKEFIAVSFTFLITMLAWILFRAENISHAAAYYSGIFSPSIFQLPEVFPKTVSLLLSIFMVVEWIGRTSEFALQNLGANWKKHYRYVLYFVIIISLFWFGGEQQQFIYFQF